MKRTTSFFFILGGIGIICCSCVLRNIYKYVDYNPDISQSLPDTFRVELPLQMDSSFFCIRARVNQEYDMDFIIDTGAESLARSEDLKTPQATFWGKFPLPTYNARKEWSRKDLYYYDSFDIGPLSFGKPLFKEVTSQNDSHIYTILSEHDKNILGRNILNRLIWKFSLDENKMILFSQKDHALLAQETANGYIKIEDGLKHSNCKLDFPQAGKSDKFLLDLGFEGELAIDEKMFKRLSKNIPCREIQGIKGVVYILEGVDVAWNDIVIKNCLAVYKPGNHSNLIGNGLMRRFNFVLAYTTSPKDSPQRDLYLKPVANFNKIEAKPFVSNFGFVIQKKGDGIYIGVEVNSIADKMGLKMGDRLLSIDKQTVCTANNSELIAYLADKRNTTLQISRENKVLEIHLSLD